MTVLDPRSYAARKRAGRPMIAVTIDAVALKKLDALCRRLKVSRGDAIQYMLALT
jgi:hypothetical protein